MSQKGYRVVVVVVVVGVVVVVVVVVVKDFVIQYGDS